MSLATSDATAERLRTIELSVGAILLAAMTLLAAILVRLGLIPLTRIELTAEAIAAGDLDRRVDDTDPHTEAGRLGAAFNVMVDRQAQTMRQLEASEQRMRRFIADASHELRTPLTTVRGFAELYRRGGAQADPEIRELMGQIEGAAIRMGLLVDDLLLLARLDEERPLDLTEVDLVGIAESVVRDAKTRAPDRTIRLLAGNGAPRVIGDDLRLRQVVANLVDNALVHAPAPATVTVRVSTSTGVPDTDPVAAEAGGDLPPASEYVVLDVADDGPGIPPDKAAHMFDRFYRASDSRSGTNGSGLGLAITAAILTAHRARIRLHTELGEGARFRILFPRS
ncbi:sensor histidine kinase [Nocardia cyriacigeorgica]|uniref:sensor histidine kinase n=1 Tax=Nocardia cyriacigeorgica TaxID=135487 RepID=UPI0013D61706|nr:HAMP domain-containing sensor histidine kinase [Nocardia cyriacigeorgica]NEW27722.1 HAMP domain-containing histidine kinase [Nocardia cyriacigeorgica]